MCSFSAKCLCQSWTEMFPFPTRRRRNNSRECANALEAWINFKLITESGDISHESPKQVAVLEDIISIFIGNNTRAQARQAVLRESCHDENGINSCVPRQETWFSGTTTWLATCSGIVVHRTAMSNYREVQPANSCPKSRSVGDVKGTKALQTLTHWPRKDICKDGRSLRIHCQVLRAANIIQMSSWEGDPRSQDAVFLNISLKYGQVKV